MAQRIDVSGGGGGMQGMMQMMLLLEQLEEGRAEREATREENRAQREEDKRRFEIERQNQEKDRMFKMYEYLKGQEVDGKPKYSDKQIDDKMMSLYPDMWKPLSIDGDTKTANAVKTDNGAPPQSGISKAFDEGGVPGAIGAISRSLLSGSARLTHGSKDAKRVEATLKKKGLLGTLGMIPEAQLEHLTSIGSETGGMGNEDIAIKDKGPSLNAVDDMFRSGVPQEQIYSNLLGSGLTEGVATEMMRTVARGLAEEGFVNVPQGPRPSRAIDEMEMSVGY